MVRALETTCVLTWEKENTYWENIHPMNLYVRACAYKLTGMKNLISHMVHEGESSGRWKSSHRHHTLQDKSIPWALFSNIIIAKLLLTHAYSQNAFQDKHE